MIRRLLLLIVTGALAGGCSAAAPELTPEVARDALVALIRSDSAGRLSDFPLEQYENSPIVKGKDGKSASWGPIELDLAARKYRYSRQLADSQQVCRTKYEGNFEQKKGRCVAVPPRMTESSLGRPEEGTADDVSSTP